MSVPKMIVCPHCRASVPSGATLCPKCGSAIKSSPALSTNFKAGNSPSIQMPPRTHSVAMPIALAFIACLPGLGQIANRQALKGILILIITEVLAVRFRHGDDRAGLIWLLIFGLSIIDTTVIARKLRRGQPVHPWELF